MTTLLRNRLSWLFLCLFAASAVYGQSVAPELNLTLGEQRVRFAPTRSFQEMRLEVVNSVGEIVFTHSTTEAEFDWNLRAGNSEALAPGLYRYALTLKFGEDQTRQHSGHFIVEKSQDQIWLTASDGTEVSGTALNATRSSGRSVAGFRTSEDKSVKREVSGREVVDTKGNKLTNSTKTAKQEKAVLLGTQNKVAKFDVGGVNLIDSAMTDIGHVIINSDTNLQAPGLGSLIIEGQSNKERVELRSAGGTPGPALQGKAFGGTIAAPTVTLANTDLFIIAGSGHNGSNLVTFNAGTVKIKAEQTWTPTANGSYINFETTPSGSPTTSRAERMRITGDGNVGIGNPAPGAKLDVVGDIRSSALRQELNVNAPPNILNGFMGTGSGGATPGNRVTAGVAGASIGGGAFNGTLNLPSGGTLSGDNSNRVTDWFGTVGGGFANRAGSDDATLDNALYATVSGGNGNIASHVNATVGGGRVNTASGSGTTVAGGNGNIASSLGDTVSGGRFNTASGGKATVAGGENNIASGPGATVPGGTENTALGGGSLAAGQRAKANHNGAFVWADSIGVDFASTGNDQFLIRAANGVGIGLNNPSSPLTVNGVIESKVGGIKFPDGSTQTTAISGVLAGDVTGTQSASVVSSVGGQSASNIANGVVAANAATATNTPNTIVRRDASGNFAAGMITGNGAGLTNVPGTFQWQVVAGTTQQALPNTGYMATDSASQVTITLPTAPNVGDTVRVSGAGAGGWKIAQNAGQSVIGANLGSIGANWAARDSNRNWQAVASSTDGSKLVALDSGQIYTSTDSGVSWTPRATISALQAVASSADGSKLVVVTFGGQIHTSTDSGVSWTARATSFQRFGVASSADGSKLVTGNYSGQILTSTDSGVTWTPRDSPRQWLAFASSADGNKLVATVYGGQIYTSTDSGVTWTPRESSRQWRSVASSSDASKLVAVVDTAGQVYTSNNSGVSWTPRESNRDWWSVASSTDGSKLVAVARNNQIYTSTDSGLSWTPRENNRVWLGVASSADGNKLVAVVQGGQIYTSTPITAVGTTGYLSGGQFSSVELQYIGNGQFIPLSHEGMINSN